MLSGRFIAADRRATTAEICKRLNELVERGFKSADFDAQDSPVR
jgi:hypothetical protein